MAWQNYQRSLCTGCGFPTDETVSPDREHAREFMEKWDVPTHTCTACAAREAAQRKFSTASDGQRVITDGVYFQLRKR